MDNLSVRRMCTGREFRVDGAEVEKACDEKLLVMPHGLARSFMSEERKNLETWVEGSGRLDKRS